MKQRLLLVFALLVLGEPVYAQDVHNERAWSSAFVQHLDSLFVQEQYAAIVTECQKDQPYYNYKTVHFNLIAAFYFMGEKDRAFALLEKTLGTYPNTYAMVDILMGDYTGYRQLLAVSEVKAYLMTRIYQKLDEEMLSDKEHAKALLAFIIDDQWTRFMSRSYTKVFSKTKFPYSGLIEDSTSRSQKQGISTAVFEFYKETGKIFSKAEVGSLYHCQLLLFFHEDYLPRRAYYYNLLQVAVQEDIFHLVNEVNFNIATELAASGNISTYPPPELVAKYRKLYNMPDYQYSFL